MHFRLPVETKQQGCKSPSWSHFPLKSSGNIEVIRGYLRIREKNTEYFVGVLLTGG